MRDNIEMTNAKAEPETAEQYKARLAAYVDGKDPIEIQRQTPAILAHLIEGVSPEKLKQSPAPGKWSISSILAHLADDEIASGWRYRQMVENSGVTLSSFDQDEWARLGDYGSSDPGEALEMFRLLRAANLRMLARLTAEEWQCFGIHSERGKMTVKDLASQMAGHDVNHIEQVRQILAVTEPRA